MLRLTRAVGVAVLLLSGAAYAASPVVVDNGSAQFSTVGAWPASTAVSGYEGTNYQTHAAKGDPPGAIVVDNTDAGFSVSGTWPASTAVSGYLGTNYQVHSADGEEPSAVVVDNPQGTAAGTWTSSTAVSGYYGANYQVYPAGTGGSFSWTPAIAQTGSYKVYARWTAHVNRSSHAVYTVNHAAGATNVTVNQEAGSGQWNLLGTFTLNAGGGNSVSLESQTDGYVIADAIKVVPEGAAPNTATWTPVIPAARTYRVYARWTAHPNRAANAKYTVTHAGGGTQVTVNQEQNHGTWVLLGSYDLAPGQGHKVELTDQADGYVIADAIRLLASDEPEFNTATWAPNLSGSYEVYAKWTANPNRATDAKYTITHSAGSTQVTVDQQANGGTWNLLGSFLLTGASTVSLSDNANGYVIADAVRLVPAGQAATVYYIYPDQLNTPRAITNEAATTVWKWDNVDPFGANAPNEDPDGDSQGFVFNLRFPGQYFDRETNTHYNYKRYYDPSVGRYIQSDPIGLEGGINTYAYVNNNPLNFVDPEGLLEIDRAGGVTVHSNPGPPAGGTEHARHGSGQSYHVHLKDSAGREARVSTETWRPLTPEDQRIYDRSKSMQNYCQNLTEGEKKFFDRVNREIFHRGHPTINQLIRMGGGVRSGAGAPRRDD